MSEINQQNYIKRIRGENIIPNNIFTSEVEFNPGLNIIAGSNGVGKTLLLKYIQGNRENGNVVFDKDEASLKNIAAFSPKRNATKVLVEQAQQIVRRDQNARTNAINLFLNQQVQDDNFQAIKSISEYLVLAFEELRDGKDMQPTQAAIEVEKVFTELLKKIFDYEIDFKWTSEQKKYTFSLTKRETILQPNLLSSGENALISLIFAIFHSKDSAQIYLIDEPEVHLNWQLEEKLFKFLAWFCEEYQKQLIIVTHSRACFIEPYLNKTQFLIWNDNKVEIVKKPTIEIRELLAGDMIKIVNGLTTENKLVYFEDSSHKHILSKIKEVLNLSLDIPEKLGSCSEVEKFSKAMKNLKIENAYFVIDNDNRKIKNFSDYLNLIQLDKYCIENYFLDESILADIDKRTDKTKPVKDLIKESINQVNKPNFAIIKELIKKDIDLTSEVLDRIDASEFIKQLAMSLGYSKKEELFDAYIMKLNEKGLLEEHFKALDSIFVK